MSTSNEILRLQSARNTIRAKMVELGLSDSAAKLDTLAEALTAAECVELAAEMRARRNILLSQCDWTQNADTPLTSEKQAQWAQYRQALRDIPQQEGFPHSAVFPETP